MNLPSSHKPYTDVYFLRSLEILEKEGLNPFVRAQIFLRKGPGIVAGMEETISIVKQYSVVHKNGGRIYTLCDDETYEPLVPIMLIEGRVQDVMTLETMMLGVISAEITRKNDQTDIDFSLISRNMRTIVDLAGGRPVVYFGARHWRYDLDKKISKAALESGACDCSTDIGALNMRKKGIGTIPHSLECIYAWKYGTDKAVIESLKAFDRYMDSVIPRIALVDFANKEIDDALTCARSLGDRLWGVRIDTAGENHMQGVTPDNGDPPYWSSTGVCIRGVAAVRQALNKSGFQNINIVLSSGFGSISKVRAFIDAEQSLGIKLFDMLGVGELFPLRGATMDIVGVGESIDTIQPMAKAGRKYTENKKLQRVV